ncbi:uncharacterized protein LOC101851621 [Aplysia californica]|uniref:Uncharacterized protein LOC101851621 n=1 Tax=Aplysia californica TaxID=6500 RepID=A0ABM0JCT2_APLCA|nr:uncharacterized protein LOC101851621 [Aplysia californica]XP_005090741.1 uncharacterized protein LOC101851621 [Aplysia californica]XP_035827948.1 uncharacterized protein LOC101851621 [Aplysia californica]XP_035827950.1 uncharacterized protein LOC101851621 [Aplysia californica]XP_035827951.1 uncharacterized protein LOC101851621 [Aplysia californica]
MENPTSPELLVVSSPRVLPTKADLSSEVKDGNVTDGSMSLMNKAPVLIVQHIEQPPEEMGNSSELKVPNGADGDSAVAKAESGGVEEETSPESDDSKKDVDTSKAVTFAEDVEIYDLTSKAAMPITVSLDTPVHLVDHAGLALIAAEVPLEELKKDTASEDLTDSLTAAELETDSSEAEGKSSIAEISDERQSTPATRPSVLSLFKSSSVDKTSEGGGSSLKASENDVATEESKHTSSTTSGSEDQQEEAKVNGEEPTAHKEFTVVSVDESELPASEPQDRTVRAEDTVPLTEVHPLSGKTNGQSHSTDSFLHDTIGPLDNPAFLKTLHYSVSQPFDEDEHFGLQSNLDLHSVTTLQNTTSDLDGGWAWVVLCAAFLAQTIIGGSVYASGVLISAIVEEIDPDLTKASWVGSVFVCAQCLTGPFVGAALKKFGARIIVSLAGVVFTLGFLGASFSTTVGQLILTHGLIAGVGAGFILNPVFVIVGQYFCRYRGLACGLLATGAGAGMLTGGAIVSLLVRTYGLSGAYMLWSGVVFHLTAIGMLFRPSPEERFRQIEHEIRVKSSLNRQGSQQELTSGHNSMMSGLNSLFGSVNHSMMSGMDKISHGRRSVVSRNTSKLSNGEIDMPLLKAVLHKEMSRSSYSVSTNRSHHRSHVTSPTQTTSTSSKHQQLAPGTVGHGESNQLLSVNTEMNGTPTPTSPMNAISNGHLHTATSINSSHALGSSNHHLSNNVNSNGSVQHLNNNINSNSSSQLPLHHSSSQFFSTSTLTPSVTASSRLPPPSPTSTHGASTSLLNKPPPHRGRLLSAGSQSQYTSMSHISRRLSLRDHSHTGEYDNESLSSTLISQLRPRDAIAPRYALGSRSISTMMGSVASFPTSLAIIKDDLSRFEAYSSTTSHRRSLTGFAIQVLDSLRLLRNRPFLIFLLSNFMWAFGESPIMIYLPSYAVSKGTDKMQASFLYTSMGIGSMIGRLLSGLVAGDKDVGPVLLFTGSLGVAGMFVALSPAITSTMMEQVVVSCLLGLYTGALVPLTSLITIDLLGIGELGIGFGFLLMSQGLGYLIGPPLAGMIVKELGFARSFLFAGFLLMGASLFSMIMALFLGKQEDELDDDDHSLDDLERALQRISDSESDNSDEENDDKGGCGEERDDLGKGSASNISRLEGSTHGVADFIVSHSEGGGAEKEEEPVPVEEERLEPIMEVG